MALAAIPGNEVLSASQQKHSAKHPQIARMFLRKCDSAKFEKNYFGFISQAVKTAQDACSSFRAAARGGFIPDIILSCSSNGIGFALRQAFPDAFIVSMADSKFGLLLPRGRELYEARLCIQQKQFCEANLGFVNFPGEARELFCRDMEVRLPFVDADLYRPGEGKGQKPVITIMAGALDNRALLNVWALCLALLRKSPDLHIVVLAENSLKDFRWREQIASLGADAERISAEYWPSTGKWLEIIQESRAVLCLSADSAVCRRVLEAMSCQKVLIVGANSLPWLEPGQNCLPMPEKNAAKLLCHAINNIGQFSAIARGARKTVVPKYAQNRILPGIINRILTEYGKWKGGGCPDTNLVQEN